MGPMSDVDEGVCDEYAMNEKNLTSIHHQSIRLTEKTL